MGGGSKGGSVGGGVIQYIYSGGRCVSYLRFPREHWSQNELQRDKHM